MVEGNSKQVRRVIAAALASLGYAPFHTYSDAATPGRLYIAYRMGTDFPSGAAEQVAKAVAAAGYSNKVKFSNSYPLCYIRVNAPRG